jgi:hypothetical protein
MQLKRIIAGLFVPSLIATALSAHADETQAYLGIFAETAATRTAGVPKPKLPPGFKESDLAGLPAGIKLPPEVTEMLAMLKGAQRKLTVRLWSSGLAPDGATAALTVPEGLKIGPKLDLDLYRPRGDEGDAPVGAPGTLPDLVIKRYWGSSANVRAGQPDVLDLKSLTPEQKGIMRSQSLKMQRAMQRGQTESYFYKPNWTTAYFPSKMGNTAVPDEGALAGRYLLASSYTGNVKMEVPDTVNFLDAIEITSHNFESVVPLDASVTFRWKAVPNVIGYSASILGMEGQKTVIMWSSAEEKPDMSLAFDYLEMAQVRDLVSRKVVMRGDAVEMTVPVGIFKDCDFVMLQMIGYGPGAALDKGQPLPRVQTKTTLMVTLGGKKLKEMLGRKGQISDN